MALALTACNQLSDDEKKIIGMWEFSGIDATGRIVYRKDHTVVELFPEYDAGNASWVPTAWGSWRLEGSEIVSEIQALPIPKMPPIPKRIVRTQIREFRDDKLVREEGRSDLVRIKRGAEVYQEAFALSYAIASVFGLGAAIYGIRKSSYRAEFVLLAVSAALAAVWSTSILMRAMAQMGHVVVSSALLRPLRLPVQIVGIIAMLTFLVGFTKLAYRLRKNKGQG